MQASGSQVSTIRGFGTASELRFSASIGGQKALNPDHIFRCVLHGSTADRTGPSALRAQYWGVKMVYRRRLRA